MKPNRLLLLIFAIMLIGCRTVNLQGEQPSSLEPETQSLDILNAPLVQQPVEQPQQAQETAPEQPAQEQAPAQEQPPAQEQAPEPTTAPQPAQEQAPVTDRQNHIVRSGEIPGSIAEAYGVPLDLFLQVNGLNQFSIIYPENSLVIPSSQEVVEWQNTNPEYIAPDPNANTGQATNNTGFDPNNYFFYTVSYGETLGSIALAYGFTIEELAAYNGIANVNDIDINQQLRIPNR